MPRLKKRAATETSAASPAQSSAFGLLRRNEMLRGSFEGLPTAKVGRRRPERRARRSRDPKLEPWGGAPRQ